MFHVEQFAIYDNVPRETMQNVPRETMRNVPRETFFPCFLPAVSLPRADF